MVYAQPTTFHIDKTATLYPLMLLVFPCIGYLDLCIYDTSETYMVIKQFRWKLFGEESLHIIIISPLLFEQFVPEAHQKDLAILIFHFLPKAYFRKYSKEKNFFVTEVFLQNIFSRTVYHNFKK